jgi:hypothetical protein
MTRSKRKLKGKRGMARARKVNWGPVVYLGGLGLVLAGLGLVVYFGF